MGKLWKTYETYGKIQVEPANAGKYGIYMHGQKTKTYETYYGKCRLKQHNSAKGFKMIQRAKQWMQATEARILTYLIHLYPEKMNYFGKS